MLWRLHLGTGGAQDARQATARSDAAGCGSETGGNYDVIMAEAYFGCTSPVDRTTWRCRPGKAKRRGHLDRRGTRRKVSVYGAATGPTPQRFPVSFAHLTDL